MFTLPLTVIAIVLFVVLTVVDTFFHSGLYFALIVPLGKLIVVVDVLLNLNVCLDAYIDSGAYITIEFDFPQLVTKFAYAAAILVNAGPKSNVVIAFVPHLLNIFVMSVTLFVLNLFPRLNFVNAVSPHPSNMYAIFVTLLVSNLLPNVKLVIAVCPHSLNIHFMSVTLLVLNPVPNVRLVIANLPQR